jgi:hypothetical protein
MPSTKLGRGKASVSFQRTVNEINFTEKIFLIFMIMMSRYKKSLRNTSQGQKEPCWFKVRF